MRKPTMWFLNQFYTNRAVQAQTMARDCSETKSFTVTLELICAYAFSYAKWCFSHDAAQINHQEVLNKSMISRKGGVLLNFLDT